MEAANFANANGMANNSLPNMANNSLPNMTYMNSLTNMNPMGMGQNNSMVGMGNYAQIANFQTLQSKGSLGLDEEMPLINSPMYIMMQQDRRKLQHKLSFPIDPNNITPQNNNELSHSPMNLDFTSVTQDMMDKSLTNIGGS